MRSSDASATAQRQADLSRRRVLLIAFHYPPCATSSGMQRTLAFSRDLHAHGWDPIVLTVDPRAYQRTSEGQIADIPSYVDVHRARAIDVSRLLSVSGRYVARLAVPDQWWAWSWTALLHARRLVEAAKVDVIWSTYPIASAHVLASRLHRLTGRPWIADFRDPMVEYVESMQQWFPKDEALRRSRLAIERNALEKCARAVYCTSGASRIVSDRYAGVFDSKLAVIPNGFDEDAFQVADSFRKETAGGATRRVLLHSGTIYPGADRDPTALFRAVRQLLDEGLVDPTSFELRLRDPSNEEYFTRLAQQHGVSSVVSILPPLPYYHALAEMMEVSALLVLQGHTSNPAVPAKLYEYLRAQRPIIGLVDPAGETAATLAGVGIDTTASLVDASAIYAQLRKWLGSTGEEMVARLPGPDVIARLSRRTRAMELAGLLDSVAGRPGH